MDVARLAQKAHTFFSAKSSTQPTQIAPLPGLTLLHHPKKTSFEASLYEPVLCLILQGRKETTLGDRTLKCPTGACLLVSHDLPVVSRVVEAPYTALLLDLEVPLLRGLYDEVAQAMPSGDAGKALEVHPSDATLRDALGRYLALAHSDVDARVLGPMLRREIHYRLLMAPFGSMLCNLLRHDSHASAVANAIARMRRDLHEGLAVPELARSVGMSTSSFHKHFKQVTSASPRQYQKDLRLMAARRMLLSSQASVSHVAFEVGYESPSQFSREYARKFGVPPSREAASR